MLYEEAAPRQNANRKLHMQVTVLKHYNQNTNRRKSGPFPEVNCFNLNDYPPTSRYLHLHPVFKLVDSFLGSSRAKAMRRTNNANNNGNKMPCLCYDGNNIGNKYTMRKSSIPNYNAAGIHAACVKNRQERIRTNMFNINTKSNLRLSLNGQSRPKICKAEVERQEAPVKPQMAITDNYYVEQLKYEMKNNYVTKCSHLCEKNTEYVEKLKDEMTVAKAVMSEEKRNTINELKNEINNYRSKAKTPNIPSRASKMSRRTSGSKKHKESIMALPEPVKQVARPAVEEKCDPDGPFETLWRSRVSLASSSDRESLVSTSPKLNFEEKLEEANILIDKVRKALKDLGMGQHKVLRQSPAITEVEEPVKECSITSNQSNCVTATACSFKGECCALIVKKAEEKLLKTAEEKTADLKKLEDELRQKLEEELSRKKEEECQKQLEEALRKQREELLQKMEADLEKKEKEEERQKQLEEALRKQKEEFSQKMEEVEKKEKEEECQKRVEEALRKQKEEFSQKMEELEKQEKEEECQKRLEEALRKQREELLQKMEEELEKKKEEILQRNSIGKQVEVSEKNKEEVPSKSALEKEAVEEEEPKKKEETPLESTEEENLVQQESEIKRKILAKSAMGTCNCICKQMMRDEVRYEEMPEKEIPVKETVIVKQPERTEAQEENLEWISSSDKDIIMDKPRDFESSMRSESYEMMEEKLKTISELSLEEEEEEEGEVEEEEEKEDAKSGRRESSVPTIGIIERACSPLTCQMTQELQSGDARSHCSTCMPTQSHSLGILHNEEKNPECMSTISSKKSAKLCIQNLPPISIRSGLVIQRTLNLAIKPTGSVTNTIGEDRSNVGYQEVKVESEHGLLCPQDCKDIRGDCRFRVIENLMDSQSEAADEQSIAFINKLNDEAVELLKSYQIYDQHRHPDGRSSATSLANLTHRLLRTLYESQLEEKGVGVGSSICEGVEEEHKENVFQTSSFRPSFTNPSEQMTTVIKEDEADSVMPSEEKYHVGDGGSGSLRDSRTSSELRSDAKEMLDNLLKQSRTPSELGFYKTVATQMSDTSLVQEKQSDASDFITDGYSRQWSSVNANPSSTISNHDWRKTTFKTRKEDGVEEMPVVVEEEPVRDDTPVEEVCSESETKRRVSLNVDSSDDLSSGSGSGDVSVATDEGLRPAELTQEPRKSILSNKSSVEGSRKDTQKMPVVADKVSERSDLSSQEPGKSILSVKCSVEESRKEYHKKSVSDSSSEEINTSSTSLAPSYGSGNKGKQEKKKDVVKNLGDLSSSSTSTSSSSIFKLKDKSEERGEKRSKQSVGSYVIPEPPQGTKEDEKTRNKLDKEQQTSLASVSSSSSTASTSSSADKVNTIKSFIQGLTGTSEEKLAKLRSTASFPKNDIQAWSKTVLREKSNLFPQKGSATSERSEKEVGSLSYSRSQQEPPNDVDGSDLVMSDDFDDKPIQSSQHDFRKFAKDALKVRRERKEEPVVMMMTEERTMENGEGGNQRNLPFYKRVLGRVVDMEHPFEFRSIHSDPIHLDESVSEGEIKCKCSVSTGEVHSCKFVPERRTRSLKNRPEDGRHRRETNDKSIRLARQRTHYNNWIQYYLQKRNSIREDVSIASSINSPK